MIVCGHGDVSEYCEAHDMIVADVYSGEIEEYRGVCPVLVTDKDISETEYFYLKGRLLGIGIELVSTRHSDNKLMAEFVIHSLQQKEHSGGRTRFGFHREGKELVPYEKEMKVVRRILKLRDEGHTYRAIRADKEVRHVDGRLLSASLLQAIVTNRESYEV